MQIIERPGFGICFPHCHTSASDGRYSADRVVLAAKIKGSNLVAILDHDSMDAAKEAIEAGKKYGINVLIGEEITSETLFPPVHILAYGIKKHIKPFMGPEETIEEVDAQGGVPILAHPLRGSVGSNKTKMDRLIEKGLVGVEVQGGNSQYSPEDYGLDYIKTRTASSDSHHAEKDIDCSYTYFQGETEEDFLESLREGKTIPHFARSVSIPVYDSLVQSGKALIFDGGRRYLNYREEALRNIKGKISRNVFQIPKEIYSSFQQR